MPNPNHSGTCQFEADRYDRLISKQPDLTGTCNRFARWTNST